MRDKGKRKWSILRWILVPTILLAFVEVIVMLGGLFGTGIINRLNQNAQDLFDGRTDTVANDLENNMLNNWSDIESCIDQINADVESKVKSEEIKLEELEHSSASSEMVLTNVVDELISVMRTNRVTGVYVVLNTSDLDELSRRSAGIKRPGIYIRDYDAKSSPSRNNTDLLFERASNKIVQSMHISTNTGWTPMFEWDVSLDKPEFFYYTFQKALENKDFNLLDDYGYWSRPYTLKDGDIFSISYSLPLKLSDGTVYGVMGIDLTLDFLQQEFRNVAMLQEGEESFFLGIRDEKGDYTQIVGLGPVFDEKEAGSVVTFDEKQMYLYSNNLSLYNSNTPFANQQWVFVGLAPKDKLFAFSGVVEKILLQAIVIALVIAVLVGIFISFAIASPIANATKEVRNADSQGMIHAKPTRIAEVDELLESIAALNKKVQKSVTKFTYLMRMASVRLAGFEINIRKKELFVTDNFFELFGMESSHKISYEEFVDKLKALQAYGEDDFVQDKVMYKLLDEKGYHYLQLNYFESRDGYYGLLEDVTDSLLEKELLKQERDHDILTGLYNRRAFTRISTELFSAKAYLLKTAAVMMVDLDNLKQLNDSHGHETGDNYIATAAACFVRYTPKNTLAARISGDEFNLIFYGYDTKEEVRNVIQHMMNSICNEYIQLPNGEKCPIKMSGGIAWYPDDSTTAEVLLRYADYAMYQVKHSAKGRVSDFDLGSYNQAEYQQQKKREFFELITNKRVTYYFQPIVDARTNGVFAYEMLLRGNMPTLKSPHDILQMAKEVGELHAIEELTMECSVSTFATCVEEGDIAPDCKMFINTIPNQVASAALVHKLMNKYGRYSPNVVIEFTEEEKIDPEICKKKLSYLKKIGASVALDDYGSGYNSEQSLLQLSPVYIKIDMMIIRNIDKELDKQEIVSHIVNFAHDRGKYIIAEGVESKAEVDMVKALGVDYLQGYYYGKPAPRPLGEIL